MSLTRHACTEGGIEHSTMAKGSRCRRLYPRVLSWFGASLKSCVLASSHKGRPIFSGGGYGGVIGSCIARMGKGTDASVTTIKGNASTLLSRGQSPFHTRGTKPHGFPSSEASSTEGYHLPLPWLALWEMLLANIILTEGTQREDVHHAFTHSSCELDPG